MRRSTARSWGAVSLAAVTAFGLSACGGGSIDEATEANE